MSFSSYVAGQDRPPAKPEPAPAATPAGSDPKPAAPASGPTSVPSTAPGNAPAPAPASDTTGALEDDGDVGFGLDDEADTDDDDEGGAPAAEVVPIGPPPNATPAEIDAFREKHGIPAKPEAYQPPEIKGGWDTEALAPVLAVVHKHNTPQHVVAEALEAYAAAAQQKLAAQQVNQQRQDKERMAEARQRLTPGEKSAVNAAASAMSPDLRSALKGARLPSGEPLLANVEFLALIAGLNKRGGGNTTPVTRAQDDAQREREIREVMRRDMGEYFARGLDKDLSAIINRREGR